MSYLHCWSFDRRIAPPEADITIMCPWAFVRFMWHTTSKGFRHWPATLDTGIVWGWRWPWRKTFREKSWWLKREPLPLALFGGPMDEVYLVRALGELQWPFMESKPALIATVRHIAPTVKAAIAQNPPCDHNYWTADCPDCARKALRLAIQLKTKYEPVPLIDPHEDPRVAFRRREVEAKKRLAATQAHLEKGSDAQD